MHSFPERHFVAGFKVKRAFNDEIVGDTFKLLIPEKMNIILISDTFEKGAIFEGKELKFDDYEPNYDYNYEIQPVQISPNTKKFDIVKINQSIPEDLSIVSCEFSNQRVVELESNEQLKI